MRRTTPTGGTAGRIRAARVSRRHWLGDAAAAALVAGIRPGGVHAAGSDEIPLALVGCGGRGGGAVVDALSVAGVRLRVVALADLFAERVEIVARSLASQFPDRAAVPPDRTFVGFDAYRQALDVLPRGGIAVCATPPAFRAVHFARAIDRGVHVFMEKPVSVDGPSTRRMIDLAARADAAKLKVAVGLMCRHCDRRRELHDRLRSGAAGDVLLLHGCRNHPPVHPLDLFPGPGASSETLWQVQRFHNFLWASGGIFSDYAIHQIDEACWMKDAWPERAEAVGGRHVRGRIDDQNFDVYAVQYTFADGGSLFYECRLMANCAQRFALVGQGSKGAFTVSASGHAPARCALYRGGRRDAGALLWAAAQPEPNPYRREWEHFLAAIIADTPYNEARRGAEASLAAAMGRFAAHTGRPVTFTEMLACPDDLTAGVDALTAAGPAPLRADADGRYPVPVPGRYRFEYRD